ncbi:elongation factor G [bacterium]|nr:elongation factor G [bacterium]MBT4291711.1 elongation factor G [bacterium]
MKTYATEQIRNVLLIAPHGVGKTTLADAMLHVSGSVGRRGNVDDGSSMFDYLDEEISRHQTMSASMAWVDVNKTKINVIDVPGVADFRCDLYAALRVVESGLFMVKADGGLEVSSDALWRLARKQNLPMFLVITRMNKDNADFEKAMREFNDHLEGTSVAVQLPIGKGESFKGIVDLIGMKAYEYVDGKANAIDIPADMADAVEEAREELMSAAAEADDDLIEKFFEEGTLSNEDLIAGLSIGIASGEVHPVFVTAADAEIGVGSLMNSIVDFMPAPSTSQELTGTELIGDDEASLTVATDGPAVAFAFKYQRETQGGDNTWLKVISGSLSSGENMDNSDGNSERIGQLSFAQGKTREKIDSAACGDIVLAAKLKHTSVGATLCSSGANIDLGKIAFQAPTSSEAIFCVNAGDEDKMGIGLSKINDEDSSFEVRHEPALAQTLLVGQGEMHLAFILEKLKNQYGVEMQRKRPRVAFKETIRKSVEVHGRYKKQSGGRGQFGDVWLKLEPQPRGDGFEFINAIVGGAVDGKFIPAVEKGSVETLKNGIVAGYEVVDIKVTLYDGSYHQVDSSENSFKSAARVALTDGVPTANPGLLEPIMSVTIRVPEMYMGEVMGDISTRRGQPLGMEADGPIQVIKASIPQDEMYQYATSLRAMTQGTGDFAMEFSKYANVPGDVAKKLIADYEKRKAEGSDD